MSHLALNANEHRLDINVGFLESTIFILTIQMNLVFTNSASYQFVIFLLVGVWDVGTVMI